MIQWLQEHLPEGGIIAIGFLLLKWLLGREVKRVESDLADKEARLRRIEDGRITQANIDELRMSLMATITHSHGITDKRLDDLRDSIARITEHLLGRK